MRSGNSPSRLQCVCLPTLLLAAALAPAWAQMAATYQGGDPPARPADAPGADRSHSLSGTVINGATGEAIRRVYVQLAMPESRSTLTDNQGNFSIDQLPKGGGMLIIHKPGYFTDRGKDYAQQRVNISEESARVSIRLVPAGAITGRLLTPEGEPIAGLSLHAVEKKSGFGSGSMLRFDQVRSTAQSDENGNFRLANLPAGGYYLQVEASSTPRLALPGPRPGREVIYPVRYFPGVGERSAATALELHPGEELTANFTLTAEPVYRVAGKLAADQGVPVFYRMSGEDYDFQQQATTTNDRFECKLPAGSYMVRAQSSGAGKGRRGNERLVLTSDSPFAVSDDEPALHINLLPAVSIPVRIIKESSGQSVAVSADEPPPVSIMLEPLHPVPGQSGGWWVPQSQELLNVEPGSYQLRLSSNGRWRIKSASSGASDLVAGKLTVRPGSAPEPIDIVLSDDTGSVRGSIAQVFRNLPEPVLVLLVSRESDAQPLSGVAQNDLFTIPNVPPGDYYALAFDVGDLTDLEPTEGFEPLRRYASQGTPVTVPPRGTATITVTPLELK